jgi:hypothetical protein
VARLNTGIDGGMNHVFASKIPDASTGLSEVPEDKSLSVASFDRAPGTIPPTVNPPRPSDNLLVAAPAESNASAAKARVASASKDDIGGLLAGSHKPGESTAAARPAPSAPASTAARHEPAPRPQGAAPKAAETKQAAASRPPLKPSVDAETTSSAPVRPSGMISGGAPVVSSNSFDSRFSAFR